MGVNWESEYKKHLIKKYDNFGLELKPENISIIQVEFDVDISLLSNIELCRLYADCIMREYFEYADYIREEIKRRDSRIELSIDEKTNRGKIYLTPAVGLQCIEIDIIVTPEGLMVDFDKEENNSI